MPPTTITYTLHPTPSHSSSSSSVLHNAVAGIQAHLPLRNLHWKSSSRTSLRTIQEIDIDLVDLGEATSLRDKNTSVLDSPLVNMCLVVCEVRRHVVQGAMTIEPADIALASGRGGLQIANAQLYQRLALSSCSSQNSARATDCASQSTK